jgi:Zn-dependent peptidase ImmA (M78 family)/DNA-binding XRE family transcriptional regulator
MAFSPSRLEVARQRRGMSKVKLADAAGVTTRSLTAYESGATEPTPETVAQLARALSFPIEFFDGAPISELPAKQASFRALSALTAGRRDAALAAGRLAFVLSEWLDKSFNLPIPEVPDLRHDSPESAADALRSHWQRGERPIRSMVHLLESKGVRVFSLPEESRDIDAFSLWHNGVPFVFLNTMKSGERGRFDAAHELGHLVLHRHAAPQGREAEHEADAFASAFLMPRGAVVATTPAYVDVDRLVRLKTNWNVSVAALARRLHDIGLVSEWVYRSMCIEIAQRGYRTREPNGIEREASQLLDKVFKSLHDEGITRAALARVLHMPQAELESLVFGLVLSSVDGGRPTDEPTRARGRAHLKLV